MFRHATAATLAFASVLGVAGCTGAIESGSTADDAPAGTPPPGSTSTQPQSPRQVAPGGDRATPDLAGPFAVRRLTRDELDNTLHDLLGDQTSPARDFPSDARGGHGFLEAVPVADVVVQRLLDASADVAASAIKQLGALFSCDPVKAGENACVTEFIKSFGRRAFRRPLTPDDVAAFQELDRQGASTLGYAYPDRLRLLVRAFVQSPELLYVGPMRGLGGARTAALVALGDHELASRLSYFLWKTMPDEALLASADARLLSRPAELAQQVRRMLADPRSQQTLREFHVEWLTLDKLDALTKDAKTFPLWNAKVQAAVQAEPGAFLGAWAADGASFEALLTAPYTVGDANLARIYGVAAATGRLALDPRQRAGILTHAAWLSAHADAAGTKPVARGRAVFEQILCGTIPPPPLDVPEPRPPMPGLTTRERYAEHGRSECAAGCHGLMDPLGFAFETYDGIGAYRTTEAGKPVDASGTVVLATDGPRPFVDAVALARILAASADVRRCAARNWVRYALGRRELDTEQGSVDSGLRALGEQKMEVRELMAAVATSRAFLNRTPAPGEVQP
jgi:hypothetical protein